MDMLVVKYHAILFWANYLNSHNHCHYHFDIHMTRKVFAVIHSPVMYTVDCIAADAAVVAIVIMW